MEPNNNQPINTNPLGQAGAPQPVPTPPVNAGLPTQQPTTAPTPAPTTPPTPTTTPPTQTPTPEAAIQSPEKKGKKGAILLLILLILVLGMGAYVLFAKDKLNTSSKTPTTDTSLVVPTVITSPTATPTPASVEQLIVESPETDLSGIEKDLQGL